MPTLPSQINFDSNFGIAPCTSSSGPWIDGNGNLYVTLIDNGDRLEVSKSTDGGDNWAFVDGANRPLPAMLVFAAHYDDDTDTIYITAINGSSEDMEYYTVPTSSNGTNPDTWQEPDTNPVLVIGADEDIAAMVINVRGDGDVIVFHNGDTGNIHGTRFGRAWISRREGGTWTFEQAVDDGGEVDFIVGTMVRGASDLMHLFYNDTTNANLIHKSLNSSNTLSSAQNVNDTVTATGTTGAHYNAAGVKAAYYNNGTVDRITVCWKDSDGSLWTSEIDDDGTPAAEESASDNDVDITTSTSRSNTNTHGFVVGEETEDTAWMVYVHDTNNDIYLDKNVDGAGWGTDTVEEVSITAKYISGNIYVNPGGDTVIGLMYTEGITMDYNEIVIIAAAVDVRPPPMLVISEPLDIEGLEL